MTQLTVLSPALNEAESLKTFLPSLKSQLEMIGVDFELLIVDGGSTDATEPIAKEHGARVIRQQSLGFGGAVRDGISAAKGEYILEMDADGSHPPEMAPIMWQARKNADLVIASRYMSGGAADMSAFRYGLSWILNSVCRAWLGWRISDASSGLRIYRAAAVKPLKLDATDFTIQQQTLAHILAAGGTAAEVPFHYGERRGGASKARVLPLAASYFRMLFRLKAVLYTRKP
jgi:glycosyltransferase involved in cell wall biosynthesis